MPASGTRRIAILFVDTSSQRYTTDAPTHAGIQRDRWMNELINGVTAGGVTQAAHGVLPRGFVQQLRPLGPGFGPVSLPDTFTRYFNADGTPKGAYFQACFTAGDSPDRLQQLRHAALRLAER